MEQQEREILEAETAVKLANDNANHVHALYGARSDAATWEAAYYQLKLDSLIREQRLQESISSLFANLEEMGGECKQYKAEMIRLRDEVYKYQRGQEELLAEIERWKHAAPIDRDKAHGGAEDNAPQKQHNPDGHSRWDNEGAFDRALEAVTAFPNASVQDIMRLADCSRTTVYTARQKIKKLDTGITYQVSQNGVVEPDTVQITP